MIYSKHKEVERLKKQKGKAKYMKIKVKAETGETVKVVGNDEVEPDDMAFQELDLNQLEQIYQGFGKFQCVGVVLHSHSSPG